MFHDDVFLNIRNQRGIVMLQRQELEELIQEIFAVATVKLRNKSKEGQLGENIYWEDIIMEVLNLCFDYHLVNLNRKKKNYPGIDLGDEELGIGIQVSVTSDRKKIKDTLTSVIENRVYEQYPKIKIMILGEKQKSYKPFDEILENKKVQFDVESDILDFSDVFNKLKNLKYEKIHDVLDLLKNELNINGSKEWGKDILFIKEKYRGYLTEFSRSFSILGAQKEINIEKAWISLNVMNEKDVKNASNEGDYSYLENYANKANKYDIETLTETERNVIVLAGPGMGKSVLCKKLIHMSIKKGRMVAFAKIFEIACYMKQGYTFLDALEKGILGIIDAGDIVGLNLLNVKLLILDGLDEAGDMRGIISKELYNWSKGHEKVRIIITSRPIGYKEAYFENYVHTVLLPIQNEKLIDCGKKLIRELEPADTDKCCEWFESQMESSKIKSIVQISPLILGFLAQLATNFKPFGKNRLYLYDQIMQVWLEGSSRNNPKQITNTELMFGIEMIAFFLLSSQNDCDENRRYGMVEQLGKRFQQELSISLMIASQKAEQCIEFWVNRGIIDYVNIGNEPRYIFLHLNIGEYLAAKYLSKMNLKEQKNWIRNNCYKASWHEVVRMAVGLESEPAIENELYQIEIESNLPTASLFLVAEGLSEKKSGIESQKIYDKLLEYIGSDNLVLSKKAYDAIEKNRESDWNWHTEKLEELMESRHKWVRYNAYGVYLSMPREHISSIKLKEYILNYKKDDLEEFDSVRSGGKWKVPVYVRGTENLLEKSILLLRKEEFTEDILEKMKEVYSNKCNMHMLELLTKILNENGQSDWVNAEQKKMFKGLEEIRLKMDQSFMRMQQYDKLFIDRLFHIVGGNENESIMNSDCIEFSKLFSALDLWNAPAGVLCSLAMDFEKEYIKKLIDYIILLVNIDREHLKKELCYIKKKMNEEKQGSFYNLIKRIDVKCDWDKASKVSDINVLLECFQSKSDYLFYVAAEILIHSSDLEKVKECMLSQIQIMGSKAVNRIQQVVPYIFKDDSMKVLFSIVCMWGEVRAESFEVMEKCNGEFDILIWRDIIKNGLQSNNSKIVSATANCIAKSIDRNLVPGALISELIEGAKVIFYKWDNKMLKCTRCEEEVVLDKSGYCPKCHTGADLPFKELVLLVANQNKFSNEELITLSEHQNRDISKVAEEQLQKNMIEDEKFLKYCLTNSIDKIFPVSIFRLILKLPSTLLVIHKNMFLEVMEGEDMEFVKIILGCINSQEWLTDKEKKEFLELMLKHVDENVRGIAMLKWLEFI